MRILFLLVLSAILGRCAVAADAVPGSTLVVVVGAPGEDAYFEAFVEQATRWRKTAKESMQHIVSIGLRESSEATNDLQRLEQVLKDLEGESEAALWLVLIGHGSFDGKNAAFNLVGPDLAPDRLNTWLKAVQRPTVVINTTASSAPFLSKLAAPNRLVLTATRSGYESSFSHFGKFLSEAISDTRADRDKDGQVSMLEAWLTASFRVKQFYETEGRILTEHALIEDNGDGKGMQAEWFKGNRPDRSLFKQDEPDGYRARQIHLVPSEEEKKLSPERRSRRDRIERELFALRDGKDTEKDEAYYQQLERLLMDIGEIYGEGKAEGAGSKRTGDSDLPVLPTLPDPP